MTNSNEGFMDALALTGESSSLFDEIKEIDEFGNEFWSARQMQVLLGYSRWQRFEDTIERAKLACQNSGYSVDSHFTNAENVVERPQKGGSIQADYKLSRYACYLTAMNGDPRKPKIAAAQTYFAMKTRVAELGSNVINNEELFLTKIISAMQQIVAPINQKLEQLEQSKNVLPPAKSTNLPWTLPKNTPTEEVPEGYMQIEDGSWLSPDAYEFMLRQSRRSLPWEIRDIKQRTGFE
jgi:hypothetical protein